ncbi:MAG TPA: cytochrome ubiquinol oxidase subunit I [Vicinamibacteria bacterium]|nr:cytochrome ubiquinol oxidase subunit I [Vicinamibacteria bacterium]
MSDLLAARAQMAMSLGFHILFAVAGIAMPLLMVIAEDRWIRRGDRACLELARRWAHGTAILFAVGAVSGTVLSFELGLLWPTFMAYAGPIFGMPFSLEGFAFFVEAIFLGVYLYGWDRIAPRAHWFAGVMVALSGVLSGVFVVIANAWMNTPAGFRMVDGRAVDVDPWAAMANAAAPSEVLHMTLAAYVSIGFAVAGIHAFVLLRDPGQELHRRALAIALAVGGLAAVLQPLSGDVSARHVARHQPVKLAAMEGQFQTERGAPLRLGGWPDEEGRTTRFALEVPYALSLLAFHDPQAEVKGLDAFPREEWPPVPVVHVAFQVMVACGTVLALTAMAGAVLAWRRRALPDQRWYLRLLVACAPLGLLALEAGWTVTEVGRQPWIVRGVMKTADAVTPMPGLVVPFATFTLLYLVLGAVVVTLLKRQVFASARPFRPPGPAGHGQRVA